MTTSLRPRPWLAWVLWLACAGLLASVQWPRSDLSGRSEAVLTTPPTLPSPETARLLSFGLKNIWADWYWLQFVQYFGDIKAREKTGYDYADDYLTLVTELDPHFIGAYSAAGFAVAEAQHDPDRARTLMARGIARNRDLKLPLTWELYQRYAGVSFLYKKDYCAAAYAFKEAVKQPGAPLVLQSFASAFYRASNDWQRAIPLSVDFYYTTPFPNLKANTRKQLIRMGVWLKEWGPRPVNLQPDPQLLAEARRNESQRGTKGCVQ